VSWLRVDRVLDSLFPPRCLLCGALDAGGPACAGCLADLPSPGGAGDVRPAAWHFGPVASAFSYEYPVDRLIGAAKFGRRVPVARGLGELMALRMPALSQPPEAVVPVPLHWRREADRGFNQAEEIARSLCRARQWPLRSDLCRRVRPTPEQSALGAADRRQNLHGAFALRRPDAVRGFRHVMVVDDVVTTGATAAAVAELFDRAGVAEVTLWTVARTPEPGHPAARKV
jgi:ComF family protein